MTNPLYACYRNEALLYNDIIVAIEIKFSRRKRSELKKMIREHRVLPA